MPSSPPDSPYFEHPWVFSAYIPDVVVVDDFPLTSSNLANKFPGSQHWQFGRCFIPYVRVRLQQDALGPIRKVRDHICFTSQGHTNSGLSQTSIHCTKRKIRHTRHCLKLNTSIHPYLRDETPPGTARTSNPERRHQTQSRWRQSRLLARHLRLA